MSRGVDRALRVVQPFVLVLLPVVLLACAVLRVPNAALVTSLVAIVSLVPFFAQFELSRLRPRDLMPIVVMTALAVAGRLVFAPVPEVKPVMAIVVITGMAFGRQSGFITGALAMLVSNMFFGQGPWTPWQMYGFGLAGYMAGWIGQTSAGKHRAAVVAFGAALCFLYGFILDSWMLIGFVHPTSIAAALATYAAGLPGNVIHAIGTVVFLLPIATAWPPLFDRIKRKYGLSAQSRPASGSTERC